MGRINNNIQTMTIHLTDSISLIEVPDDANLFRIVNYTVAGTYVVQTDSKELNAWKQKLPKGSYTILGTIRNGKPDFDCSFMAIPGEMMVASILHAKKCYEGRLLSLLQSKQVDMSKHYLVVEKIKLAN